MVAVIMMVVVGGTGIIAATGNAGGMRRGIVEFVGVSVVRAVTAAAPKSGKIT